MRLYCKTYPQQAIKKVFHILPIITRVPVNVLLTIARNILNDIEL